MEPHAADPHFATHAILQAVVVAVFLGICAQVLAHRFKLPAILPLLLLGMAAGPFGLALFDPGALGSGLEVVIHLGVAVILFEGGLSLDLHQLRQIGPALRNLLTVGTAVTWVGAGMVAHWVTGASPSTAALFGAIVTFTGPTVIAPLLRHMVAPKKVRTLLVSEGLMIDPIGAVLAYLVLQWIERAGLGFRGVAIEILGLSLAGIVLGGFAGVLAVLAVRRRFLGEELRSLVILALLFGSFLVSEMQAPQSGILASVVMGLVVSAAEIPDLGPVKAFKGQLTVLFISVLFVLLSGQLDLGAIYDLGTSGLLVVAGLILLVRPLSILASMPFGAFDWKEKLLLGLTAPRGIVAAAVASLAAIQLRAAGLMEDAAILEGLVYIVILVTCAWATVMAGLLPRLLGYLDDPARRRVALVGANGLSVALARLFNERGWTAVVVDSVAKKLAKLREQGFTAVVGDARESDTYDRAGVERDTAVVALTPNDALNLLVAELVRDDLGVEHPVVALQEPSREFGSRRRVWIDLLADRDLDVAYWSRQLDDGRARLVALVPPDGGQEAQTFLSFLRENSARQRVLGGFKGGRPVFDWSPELLPDFEEVMVLCHQELVADLEALVQRPEEAEPEPLRPAAETQ
ncbi:MAG: sodium:proton antiporter [Acidobacteriota bacterium]